VSYTERVRLDNRKADVFPRRLNRFKLGLEVLTDAIVLSRCGGLVSSSSNLTEAAIVLNDGQYSLNYAIDIGTNSKHRLRARYMWSLKNLLPEAMGGFPRELRWPP
jgi:hypothetical protein